MTIFGVSVKFYLWMFVALGFAMAATAEQASAVSLPLLGATLVCYIKGWVAAFS